MSDLQVKPEILAHASAEFSAVANELREGLGSIDTEVSDVLGSGWTGEASSSYGGVWREWHEGASKVMEGLSAMAALLADAASRYSQTDQAGASDIDGAGV